MLDQKKLEQKMNGAERPELAMAMELAALFHEEIDGLKQSLANKIGEAVNLNAVTAKRMTELEERLNQFIKDSERTRHDRADKELKEAEVRLQIAQQHRDELSTSEKLEASKIVDDRLTARERERQEKTRARLEDLLQSAIKTALNAIVGVVALAVFTGIILLVARALGLVVQVP